MSARPRSNSFHYTLRGVVGPLASEHPAGCPVRRAGPSRWPPGRSIFLRRADRVAAFATDTSDFTDEQLVAVQQREATGDFLVFADQDILFAPGYVEFCLRHARPRQFLVGYPVRLTEAETATITDDLIRAGRVTAAVAGGCDVAEVCNGTNACPGDTVRPAGTVCRASVNQPYCDPQEVCTGSSNACPGDVVTRAPSTETCNSIDDNCNGTVDEGSSTACASRARGSAPSTRCAWASCPDRNICFVLRRWALPLDVRGSVPCGTMTTLYTLSAK